MIEVGVGFRILGSCYSPDTRRLREFAARNRLPHRFIDLDQDAGAESLLRQLGIAPDETPVVIWRSDGVLRNPTNAELARLIGLPDVGTQGETYDLVIVGGGPAGWRPPCTARPKAWRPSLLDRVAAGGQAGTSVADRELPRLPGRAVRCRAGRAGGAAGREVRRRAVRPGRGRRAGEEDGYHSVRLERRHERDSTGGGDRHRRALPPARSPISTASRARACTTPRLWSRRILCVGEPVSSSVGAIRPGRLRRSSLSVPQGWDGRARRSIWQAMSRYLVDRLERMPGIEILLSSRDSPARWRSGPAASRGAEQHHGRTSLVRRSGGVRVHRSRAAHPVARRGGGPRRTTDSCWSGPKPLRPRPIATAGSSQRCCRSRRPAAWRVCGRRRSQRFGEAGGHPRWARARWSCASSTSILTRSSGRTMSGVPGSTARRAARRTHLREGVVEPGPQHVFGRGAGLAGNHLAMVHDEQSRDALDGIAPPDPCGDSSTLTFTSLTLPACDLASCSNAGLTIRHGPHHGAHRSTSTGSAAHSTTVAKLASSASAIHGSGEWHWPQRGTPLAAAGTRFFRPQTGTPRRHSRRLLPLRPHAASSGPPDSRTSRVSSPSDSSTRMVAPSCTSPPSRARPMRVSTSWAMNRRSGRAP